MTIFSEASIYCIIDIYCGQSLRTVCTAEVISRITVSESNLEGELSGVPPPSVCLYLATFDVNKSYNIKTSMKFYSEYTCRQNTR